MDYVKLEKFLKNKIPNADVDVIGKSVLGRNIYAVYFDFHSNYNVIIQASIHAREHITTSLVVKFIKDVSKNFEFYKQLNMPNIIFVPMANPDGVMISCHGLKSVKNEKVKFKLQKINIKMKILHFLKQMQMLWTSIITLMQTGEQEKKM